MRASAQPGDDSALIAEPLGADRWVGWGWRALIPVGVFMIIAVWLSMRWYKQEGWIAFLPLIFIIVILVTIAVTALGGR
jgi:hypothetical protein